MVGGMLESRIAIGCSFNLVLGMKGFNVLDLDTPLLLVTEPVQRGYHYDDHTLQPWHGPGPGMAVAIPANTRTTSIWGGSPLKM